MILEEPEWRKYLDKMNNDPDKVKAQVCNRCKVNKPLGSYYFDMKNDRHWKICRACKQSGPAKVVENLAIKSLSLEQQKNGTEKICLKCDAGFISIGKYNRMCKPCAREALDSY